MTRSTYSFQSINKNINQDFPPPPSCACGDQMIDPQKERIESLEELMKSQDANILQYMDDTQKLKSVNQMKQKRIEMLSAAKKSEQQAHKLWRTRIENLADDVRRRRPRSRSVFQLAPSFFHTHTRTQVQELRYRLIDDKGGLAQEISEIKKLQDALDDVSEQAQTGIIEVQAAQSQVFPVEQRQLNHALVPLTAFDLC